MDKKVILFDLDGTLLPQDQDKFIEAYFSLLVKKIISLNLPSSAAQDAQSLAKAVWAGTYAMMKNDGSYTNEERFFSAFSTIVGVDMLPMKCEFDKFYKNEFQKVAAACGKNPLVREAIDYLKGKECRIAVATNPLFPLIANEQRLEWAGLSLNDFEYCTCYENSSYCKPNLEYYKNIINELGVCAEECLMVGNDVKEDMVARELGMDVFLIIDCIINPENKDINEYPHGSWQDFLKYIK